jgi:hypothetical protein
MKTQNLKIAFLLTGILIVNMVFSKPKIAVANINYKGKDSNPTSLGNYLRIEMAKVDAFEVTDRYDQEYLLKKKDFTIENCYGKLCLVEVGKMLGVDKMISGSIDTYGETILLTLNLIDVATSTTEKTFVKEYLNLPQEFPGIISCAVKEMNSLPMDNEYLKRVTKKFNLESSVNNPEKTTLNMSGPRFGVAFLTGDAARVMRAGKQDGGFDGYPYLFQFKEAAILFESGTYLNLDRIILVYAPLTLRLKRVIERDQISMDTILQRVQHQWSDTKKIIQSNDIIFNDEIHNLIPQIEFLLNKYDQLFNPLIKI